MITRRALKWTIGTLAALIVVIALLASALALMDANHLRGFLIRTMAAHTGRQIRIDGPLQVHLLSRTPSVIAQQVSIDNPPWMPAGVFAQIGTLSFSFDLWPLFSNSFVFRTLEMQGAILHLTRDADGHSNWQTHAPGSGSSTGPPLIHSLSAPDAQVDLDDQRRHLKFNGTVSAQELAGSAAQPPLRIDGSGQLNGRPVTFRIDADPLAGVQRGQPYGFEFTERSSGSRLSGRGRLPQPFDFHMLEGTFEAAGEDLKDLYFLIGISMIDTGAYRLSGKFARDGKHFRYADLLASSGQSDVHGTVSIDTTGGDARLDADLSSQVLRTVDLGARAAGRDASAEAGKPWLLSDTELPLTGIRRDDAVINYHAQRFEAGRTSLHALAAHVTIDHGVLVIAPLSAAFPEGKVNGRVRFDATRQEPTAALDLHFADLQIGQFERQDKGPPALDGLLRAHVTLTGHGSSIHQLAAASNGTVTALLPQGVIRASFAELTGMDLARGLGMLLSKDRKDVAVRCAAANFQDHDGTLSAQRLVIDSEPVLITGTGQIHLDTDTLDLALHGRPKSLRLLRWHSPVVIRGTLQHPSVSIDAHQAGLAIVDRGDAQQVDCGALLNQAKADGVD